MHLFGTIQLLIFSKMSHLYVYFHLYFYSKQILMTFCQYFCINSIEFLTRIPMQADGSQWLPLGILMETPRWKANYLWSLIECHQTSHLYFYSGLYVYQIPRNFPTYTFIQSYIFINFFENFPPILLFGIVVYLELQSILF